MDPTQLLILIFIVVIALGFSFLCSILEAALLSVTVPELTERLSNGQKGAGILLDLKQNHLEYSISAILTLNTIAHTIGAALSGAQAAHVFGDAWVGVFSAVLTVLILVFTEIIPKTLGTVHGGRLAGFIGRSIKIMIFCLKPLLYIIHFLTRLLSSGEKRPVSRGELLAMVQIAAGEGTLDADTSEVMGNVLRFGEVRASDIMTPRTVIVMLPANTPCREILTHPNALRVSRIPIYGKGRDDVRGYVLTRDILVRLAMGGDPETPLSERRREVLFLPASVTLGDAMSEILERHEHMVILLDEHGGVAGLVTLEDIVETVFGTEIMDEFDSVADLREVATRLRDERLKRSGNKRSEAFEALDAEDESVGEAEEPPPA